jgi:DNA topoisomerase-1
MNYTLILSEKREAAERIARALDDKGWPRKIVEQKVPYYEAKHSGEKIIVVPAIGHLYSIAPERKGRFYYPVLNVKWTPSHLARKSIKRTRNWIEVITKLAEKASSFVSGVDNDLEGEVIGYTLLRYACGGMVEKAKRMVFSTLTREELRGAYGQLQPGLNVNLAKSGEVRHIVDFLWGVNLSRFLTHAVRRWGSRYVNVSVGRVQTPTARFLVERERAIRSFVPIPYWEIKTRVRIDGTAYEAQYENPRIDNLRTAQLIVDETRERTGSVHSVETRTHRLKPPAPFNLSELQSEAYRLFRFTPSRTLTLAERLYLHALISYPRTASQKIPPVINTREILTVLGRSRKYAALVTPLLAMDQLRPNEGPLSDPAHPAIYPTGHQPERPLDPAQGKILELVTRRFLATFSPSAVKESLKVTLKVNGHIFSIRAKRLLVEGWLEVYGGYTKDDEVVLPTFEEGRDVFFDTVTLHNRFTSPPSRFNPSSLLKAMERAHLGTKTTRAGIIDTLYHRRYVTGTSMTVSDLGFSLIEALESHCPGIVRVEFTRELEKRMVEIAEGRAKEEEVLVEVVDRLKQILDETRKEESTIGKMLSEAEQKTKMADLTVGQCPTCQTGQLMIIKSRKTGKRFVGCSNYSLGLCTRSFALPQPPHQVAPTKRPCLTCGWPVVRVKTRARWWKLCLNPQCPTKRRHRGTTR